MLLTQQLVNRQMTITTIAKYSITIDSYVPVSFEPCFDAYGQLIFIATPLNARFNPEFDCYGQLMTLT